MEVGEYGVGAYLQFVEKCDYVLYNQPTGRGQGEIDVIGIRYADRVVFVCEAAFHLRGLRYVAKKTEPGPGTSAKAVIDRMCKKFQRASEALPRMFPEYTPQYQFWTIKSRPDINNRWPPLCEQLGFAVEFIHGQEFIERMRQLRNKARKDQRHVDNPFYRTLQILEQSRALND